MIPKSFLFNNVRVKHVPWHGQDVHPVTGIAFYDLEKQDWRSFNITKFIGFVTVYKLVYFSAMNEQKIDKLSCKETR